MYLTYNAINSQYTVNQSLPLGRDAEGFNAFNCMKAYSDNGERYGYYGYDASGERTYKINVNPDILYINAENVSMTYHIDRYMLYPNGYMNVNQAGEYTKHYYADALRIASKIGSGFSQDLCDEAFQIDN